MASSITLFNIFRKANADGTIDLDSDTIKVMLVDSNYTFNAGHSEAADVSAYEVAAGSGYSAGGVALANKSVTLNAATSKFTADPATWPGLTKTFRFAVLYAEKVANGLTNPLIACVLLDTTPADVVVTAADYSIQWNANGIIAWSTPA